ncbi:hypothetical protein Aduo_018843 [Ancylostoma duodenale]
MLDHVEAPRIKNNADHEVFIALPSAFARVNVEIGYEENVTLYVYVDFSTLAQKLINTPITRSIIVVHNTTLPQLRCARERSLRRGTRADTTPPATCLGTDPRNKTAPFTDRQILLFLEKLGLTVNDIMRIPEFEYASAELRERRRREKIAKAKRRREERKPNFFVIEDPERKRHSRAITFEDLKTDRHRTRTPPRERPREDHRFKKARRHDSPSPHNPKRSTSPHNARRDRDMRAAAHQSTPHRRRSPHS